jgi:hypothetical protein
MCSVKVLEKRGTLMADPSDLFSMKGEGATISLSIGKKRLWTAYNAWIALRDSHPFRIATKAR